MFGLFKSKEDKFNDACVSYYNSLKKIADRKGASNYFKDLTSFLCQDYSNPNFKKQYSDYGYKSPEGTCEFLKTICILSLILKDFLSDKIEKDISVLARKQKMLITRDDYGDINVVPWMKEVESYYINKIRFDVDMWLRDRDNVRLFNDNVISAFSHDEYALDSLIELIKSHIDTKVDEYTENNDDIIPYDQGMDGYEYEHFVAEQFSQQGWEAQVTKGSGDHGVDIIVSYPPIKFAIQCKHYNSSVGNKAVQEVYSAKDIFDCDFAVVVSNNTYTPAAQEAANKLSVAPEFR